MLKEKARLIECTRVSVSFWIKWFKIRPFVFIYSLNEEHAVKIFASSIFPMHVNDKVLLSSPM